MTNSSYQRAFRVAVNGLPHFCQKLTQLVDGDGWEVPYRSPFHPGGLAARFIDLARCDLAYSWMGRISMGKFLWTAHALGKTKVIILWCGSDALFAKKELAQGKMNPWVRDRVHWAVSPWLAEEVRALGINCEYVQVSFVEPVGQVPLPQKFSVLVYAPSLKKSHLYGVDTIMEVANRLPSVEFKLVGLQEKRIPGCPANLRVYERVDLKRFYRESAALWRPVRHDGLPFMVLEALAYGRHVLYSYPFPACIHAVGADAACHELEKLHNLHISRSLEPNEAGRQYIAREFHPQKVRSNLLGRWEQIIQSPEHEFPRAGLRATP
jgi:hypothetical protein